MRDGGGGECPQLKNCEMFKLFTLAGTAAVWKTNYCTAEFSRCARYQLAKDGCSVAQDLLPNGSRLRKASGG